MVYEGDLGCEVDKDPGYCLYDWNSANAGGKAAIEAYWAGASKRYQYNAGHPKHPMKFSTKSVRELPDVSRFKSDWKDWVEAY